MAEPRRMVEIVPRVYWSCNDAEHRHGSAAGAAKCIAAVEKRFAAERGGKLPDQRSARAALLLFLYRNGLSMADVTRLSGLSHSRFPQAVDTAIFRRAYSVKLSRWEVRDMVGEDPRAALDFLDERRAEKEEDEALVDGRLLLRSGLVLPLLVSVAESEEA